MYARDTWLTGTPQTHTIALAKARPKRVFWRLHRQQVLLPLRVHGVLFFQGARPVKKPSRYLDWGDRQMQTSNDTFE